MPLYLIYSLNFILKEGRQTLQTSYQQYPGIIMKFTLYLTSVLRMLVSSLGCFYRIYMSRISYSCLKFQLILTEVYLMMLSDDHPFMCSVLLSSSGSI